MNAVLIKGRKLLSSSSRASHIANLKVVADVKIIAFILQLCHLVLKLFVKGW
jgi:hypothetical protein